MQSLQPKAARMEMWSHPWAISLNFLVTMESNSSSLGFQRRKVSGRGRKGLNESIWEREWTGALQEDSWAQGNFSEIFRLPTFIAMRGCSRVPPFLPKQYSDRLSANDFPFWQRTFRSSWFFWLVACKHSGCLCSQWEYKLPTSNPLSMVCDNVCTTSCYTSRCNPSNNSKK